ncbi:MAG: YcxB family protein [Ruminiclostridium sp.]|nr:YcxB family protein [Clostridia bacterium]MBQ9484315.1 YcxB family protein [Ruminiclostridium sp.]
MFEVTTKRTLEEYRKFVIAMVGANRAVEAKADRTKRVVLLTAAAVISAGVLIFFISLYWNTHDTWVLILIMLFSAFLIFDVLSIINRAKMHISGKSEKKLRETFDELVKTRGLEYTLTFGEETLDVKARDYTASIKYGAVNHLVETQTNFYISTTLGLCFIVNKDALTKDQSLFIRTHCSTEDKPQITL